MTLICLHNVWTKRGADTGLLDYLVVETSGAADPRRIVGALEASFFRVMLTCANCKLALHDYNICAAVQLHGSLLGLLNAACQTIDF